MCWFGKIILIEFRIGIKDKGGHGVKKFKSVLTYKRLVFVQDQNRTLSVIPKRNYLV